MDFSERMNILLNNAEKEREEAYQEDLNANYARTYKSSQSYLRGYKDGKKA
jgi:hypothetical protein